MKGDDTSKLVGGPISRNGGKGMNAPRLLPHFAPAKVYGESCFGAGGKASEARLERLVIGVDVQAIGATGRRRSQRAISRISGDVRRSLAARGDR